MLNAAKFRLSMLNAEWPIPNVQHLAFSIDTHQQGSIDTNERRP